MKNLIWIPLVLSLLCGCQSRQFSRGGESGVRVSEPVIRADGSPVLDGHGDAMVRDWESWSKDPLFFARGDETNGEIPRAAPLPLPGGGTAAPAVTTSFGTKNREKATALGALIVGIAFLCGALYCIFIMKPPLLRFGLIAGGLGIFLMAVAFFPWLLPVGIAVAAAAGAVYWWSEKRAKDGMELGRAVTETIDTLPASISEPFWRRFVQVASPKDKAYLLSIARSDDQLALSGTEPGELK